MKKNFLIFGLLVIVSIFLVGCARDMEIYRQKQICYDKSILDMSCEELLHCDSLCSTYLSTSQVSACHSNYNNPIIARC